MTVRNALLLTLNEVKAYHEGDASIMGRHAGACCLFEEPWVEDEVLREVLGLSQRLDTGASKACQLLRACALGQLERVHLLLDDVGLNRDGVSALHVACASRSERSEAIVSLLVSRGADVSRKWRSRTPLHVAIGHGHSRAARVLVDQNAALAGALDNEMKRPGSILYFAAAAGFIEATSMRRRLCADINEPIHGGASPLELCVEHGDVETMRFLLDRGACTMRRSGRQDLATLACAKDNVECLSALVARGCQFDAKLCLSVALAVDSESRCAWYLVDQLGVVCCPPQLVALCRSGKTRLVTALLRNGADPDAGSPYVVGTPLAAACVQGHNECVRVLIAYGADVSKLPEPIRRCCALVLAAPNVQPPVSFGFDDALQWRRRNPTSGRRRFEAEDALRAAISKRRCTRPWTFAFPSRATHQSATSPRGHSTFSRSATALNSRQRPIHLFFE